MSETEKADLGVVGLAVMGANLARNAAHKGFGVALFNRHGGADRRADAGAWAARGGSSPRSPLPDFVASLKTPRIAIIMVKAGKPVDEMIDEIMPHLEPGDILVDAGNSLFTDTQRRVKACEAKGVRFVGMGVSGGEEGALNGPSMMPGGDRAAYDRLAPFLDKMAAQAYGRPCCAYIGTDGAGHYVKMVHNGIEYADMQLIAETYDILKSVYGLDASAIADVFASWKTSALDSYLIDITTEVLRKTDATGKPLVDAILDEAEQKGTGRWTAAVRARARRSASPRSPRRSTPARCRAGASCARPSSASSRIRRRRRGRPRPTRSTRFATRSTPPRSSPTSRASSRWRSPARNTAGASISARSPRSGAPAASSAPACSTASWTPTSATRSCKACCSPSTFATRSLRPKARGARRSRLRSRAGVPTPAFSSTLAYYDGLRRARGPANLMQGLRDYFGAHTYRRLDKPGVFHTRWAQDGAEEQTG